MAHYHLRQLHHRLFPPVVLGASIGTSLIEKVNTVLIILFSFIVFLVSWRFLRLLRGEHKLKKLLEE